MAGGGRGRPADAERGATGFTNIIHIALAGDGSLHVVEIAANGLRSGDPAGALIRVLPDGTQQTIVAPGEGLFVPGGGTVVKILP